MRSLVIVFIPPDSQDIEQAVRETLAPFDCELEVEEREESCSCIRKQAEKEAYEYAVRVAGSEDEISEKFNREYGGLRWHYEELSQVRMRRKLSEFEEHALVDLSRQLQAGRTQLDAPFDQAYQEALLNYPLKEQPDPNCAICGGSGVVMDMYNPQARWDAWCIGGSYEGFFDGTEPTLVEADTVPPSEGQKSTVWQSIGQLGKFVHEIAVAEKSPPSYRGDAIPVRDIPSNWQISAAVVADGRWYAYEDFLEREEDAGVLWDEAYNQLLESHQDWLAVACDISS